jgi:hypothetical protein
MIHRTLRTGFQSYERTCPVPKMYICMYTFEPAFITGSRSYENLGSVFSWVLTFKSVNWFSLWESDENRDENRFGIIGTPCFHRHHHDVPIGSRDDLMMLNMMF